MGRYDNEDNYANGGMRQKDLVLSTNEFVFIQSKTNGAIKTYTGPIMVTISAQESMVIFNPKTKRFEETVDFEKARQLFTSAPEGWYAVLKNPAKDGVHPDAAKAMNSPELEIGRKINIFGPCSFSLFPGQMTKVIRGHRLRSNQYLLARVYDADAANKSTATIVDAEGNEVETKKSQYFVGQLLVIKGTEVSFYMPPTGIEVIPVDGGSEYTREAITLERLEYAILKDEDGEKRYIHGPAVVFPNPTETFVETPKGGNIFRALELSPISGIYVKVIADYEDGKVKHKTGEELFITGNEQMIYYPRPEHAMIQYDGKYMHHAIAIPEGEGRYILNRLSGEITTVIGPKMYLPDPRTEVVVKRKLTPKECELFYPGNMEVLMYNTELSEKATEKMARKGIASTTDAINSAYSTSNQLDTLAIFEANANISRGVSYTKPRTITLDTKYDGVVTIDVWTGYAVNLVSKNGNREVVVGPTTKLLNYEETLEAIQTPEGTSAFLRIDNNKISADVVVQTKDFVDIKLRLSYCVSFLNEMKDKWFSVENYSKFLTDRMSSLLKKAVKQYTIQDFYADSVEIIRASLLTEENNCYTFNENGMRVSDVEVLALSVERDVANMLEKHQNEVIEKTLELANAEAKMKVISALAENEKKEIELSNENALYKMELEQKLKAAKLEKEEELKAKSRAAVAAEVQAKQDMQEVLNLIKAAEIERDKLETDVEIERQKRIAEIEEAKQKAYAETVKSIMASISPDLVAALTAKANSDIMESIGCAVSPYAIANGESVSETVNTLLRGTSLQETLKNIKTFTED